MKKIETVWCQLLYQVLEKQQGNFQQQQLAKNLHLSLSTINHALRNLRQMGAVQIGGLGGQVRDAEKILMHWSNYRRLSQDIVWRQKLSGSVVEIESLLPLGTILGAYSAVRHWYGEAPADYSTVYVYHPQPELVFRRFVGQSGRETELVCLKLAPKIPLRKETTTLAHAFVDLWSLSDWMAKEFINRIKEEIDDVLS
ncbi:MAG: winged helix-turn-helix transcriptional regulator [Patescibacteria group bacterium]|nr:winged helix-turn-helix transcriptional regulator [Patescibacteria group bacterium]